MGKPVGTYLTIETPNLAMPDEKSQTVIAEKVCSFIKELIRKFEVKDKDLSILQQGWGIEKLLRIHWDLAWQIIYP